MSSFNEELAIGAVGLLVKILNNEAINMVSVGEEYMKKIDLKANEVKTKVA